MGESRVMAVDPGSRRAGIAISDREGRVALPFGVIPVSESLPDQLSQLVAEQGASEVVVGLPLKLDGSEGKEAARARQLAGALERKVGVPVRLVDERLTTVAADRALAGAEVSGRRRRKLIDQTAATLLLQSYLDGRPR